MTIAEAKATIYANVVYACEKAGFAPQTTRLVQDACDTIIALADRKVSEIPTSSENPNNCETCRHWEHGAYSHYYCARLEMRQKCHYEPKDEQQTDYTPDCPFCRKYGIKDCLGSNCRRYKIYKEEQQTDCMWK